MLLCKSEFKKIVQKDILPYTEYDAFLSEPFYINVHFLSFHAVSGKELLKTII